MRQLVRRGSSTAALGVLVLVASGVLLVASAPVLAAVLRLDLAAMTARSRLVVIGEVEEVASYRGTFLTLGEAIFTDVTIRVDRSVRGRPATDRVTIQVLGGTIGDTFLHCVESARYRKGEKVLVFLREYNGRLWNTGWLQGKYTLSDDGTTVRGSRGLPIAADRELASVIAEVERVPIVSSSAPETRGAGGAR